MSPRAASAELRRIQADVIRAGRGALDDAGHLGLALAIAMSSGDTTQAELDRENNPYGHGAEGPRGPRGPIPFGDPAMINAQTGEFRNAWRLDKTSGDGTEEGSRIVNDSDHADFMRGTVMMIRRPIEEAIEKRVAEHVEDVAAKRLRRYL